MEPNEFFKLIKREEKENGDGTYTLSMFFEGDESKVTMIAPRCKFENGELVEIYPDENGNTVELIGPEPKNAQSS